MDNVIRIATIGALTAVSSASLADTACGISLAANHQSSDHITDIAGDGPARTRLSIDLSRSQYRIGDAVWRSTQELCSSDRLDLEEGETAVVACRTNLVCGSYQFLFRIDWRRTDGSLIETRFIPFPANSEAVTVQRPRTVQLGNLREIFDAQDVASGPHRRAAISMF